MPIHRAPIRSARTVRYPSHTGPTALTCCVLDTNGQMDIQDTWTPDDLSALRITYNVCIHETEGNACPPLGDVNFDTLVDGDDIQPFVDTYYAAHHSHSGDGLIPPDVFCKEDMTADGFLDEADVACYVRALLLQGPCFSECDEPPTGESAFNSYESNSASMAGPSAIPPNDDPEFMMKLGMYLAWYRENSPRHHPELGPAEHRMLCIAFMESIGLEPPQSWGVQP